MAGEGQEGIGLSSARIEAHREYEIAKGRKGGGPISGSREAPIGHGTIDGGQVFIDLLKFFTASIYVEGLFVTGLYRV